MSREDKKVLHGRQKYANEVVSDNSDDDPTPNSSVESSSPTPSPSPTPSRLGGERLSL